MEPVADARARVILIWTVVMAHLLMACALLLGKIDLDAETSIRSYLYIAALAGLLAYAHLRRMLPLLFFFDTLVAGFLVTIPVIVWSYAAVGFTQPLADPQLSAMDTSLGFDWRWFIGLVDRHAWLAEALATAYSSFFYQLLLLPVYFALSGKGARASAIIFGYTLLCLVSSIVSIWYPAHGTYLVYGVAAGDLANINPKFGFFFLEQFEAVRSQTDFVLKLDNVAGLLTFPSVHAGVAALCAWAAWDSRLLRYPFLVLNIGMATAAVSHANHYLIDVVAGLGLAGVTISLTSALFYRPTSTRRSVVVDTLRYYVGRRANAAACPGDDKSGIVDCC